jgi:hypothetical protein
MTGIFLSRLLRELELECPSKKCICFELQLMFLNCKSTKKSPTFPAMISLWTKPNTKVSHLYFSLRLINSLKVAYMREYLVINLCYKRLWWYLQSVECVLIVCEQVSSVLSSRLYCQKRSVCLLVLKNVKNSNVQKSNVIFVLTTYPTKTSCFFFSKGRAIWRVETE